MEKKIYQHYNFPESHLNGRGDAKGKSYHKNVKNKKTKNNDKCYALEVRSSSCNFLYSTTFA